MSILSELFSGGVAKVVDSVGIAIDKLVTSDEERDKLKVIFERDLYNFKKEQMDALEEHEKEISSRHKHDMRSDSWLSKNIRPLTLAFLTITAMGLAYSTIFVLDREDVVLVEPWLDLFKILLGAVYVFYFGGRSYEKVKNHRK